MARSEARPLSTAEAGLAAAFAYLVLLISLAGARIGREGDAPRRPAAGPTMIEVAHTRPLAAVRSAVGRSAVSIHPAAHTSAGRRPTTGSKSAAGRTSTAGRKATAGRTSTAGRKATAGRTSTAGRRTSATRPAARTAQASCVTARTRPVSYAAAQDVTEPLAFGPPVEPTGPLSAAAVNGVLIDRLCYHPDPRLYAAIDAAVNGGDPGGPLTRVRWAAGVDRLVTRDGLFVRARVVTRTVPRGTATYGMRVRPGAAPLVLPTRLARQDTSRYLLLPVRSTAGRVVTLTLRLRCGFQPVLPQ